MGDGLPERPAARQPGPINQARLTPSRCAAVLALVATGLLALVAPGPSAAAPVALPTQARPSAPVSADGLQASDGQRTLRVGQSQGLPAGGTTVGVSGSGYDEGKGIYVALCVVTPADAPPSPCGGGIDQTGATGASSWVSSNPPSYGQGLAVPYGPGGTFSVNVTASPVIADGFDCRQIQCAIVTRNDHVRTGDRSQDIFVPVTFSAGEAPPPVTSPPTTAPPESTTTAPPTTIAPPPVPTTTAPAPRPTTEVSADGRRGTDGTRTITVSAAADLDPEAEAITVTGEGFDPAKGVQITLCRTPEEPTAAPEPCRAGASPDASKVVVPADAGSETDLATFAGDGAFEVELEVAAVIDGETDCRDVGCSVVVRRYSVADGEAEAAAADRTLDLVLPVAFAAESRPETTTTTEPEDDGEETAAPAAAVSDADDGGSSALPLVLGGLVLLVAAGVGGGLVVRSRRAGAAS